MNPADLTLSISPSLTSKPTLPPLSLSATTKPGKTPVPRIDLEPIYVQLKAALGEQWNDYKAAVNQFVLGNLNQAELSWVLQPLLSAAPSVITSSAAGGPNGAVAATGLVSTLTLHNTLITAIYANTLRDTPPSDVAPWVVATDKPSSSSKTGSGAGGGANDKAEERLRKEVMAVHARDRRRIKTLKVGEGGEKRGVNDPVGEMRGFRDEMGGVRNSASGDGGAAGGAGQGAGGGGMGAKTNWDIEIRRRYAAPLAGETLEFPSLPDLQTRIEPICYEEGLTSGAAPGSLQPCAEILEQATEVFLKELLGAMFANTRANGEGCIQTAKFKRQLRKEEEDVEAGVGGVVRNAGGWLPVEMEVQAKREALGMEDLRLAIMLGDNYLKQDPFLSKKVVLSRQPEAQAPSAKLPKMNGIFAKPMLNGTLTNSERATLEEAVVDGDGEAAWSWRGSSKADVSELMGVLDECLAVG